jgi:hypothetical protein
MPVELASVLSSAVMAKAEAMRNYVDEGWEVPEVAKMFGLSESWSNVLVSGRPVRRFFCEGCGAPALKKNSSCVRCDSDEVLAQAAA